MRTAPVILAATLCLASLAALGAGSERTASIEGGMWRSVLPTGTDSEVVRVAPFQLDRTPVTNADFLEFVRAHPEWQRGRVPAVFADSRYLHHWAGPLDLGAAHPNQPVTSVSWFAARAFCESRGARLPSWYEWELAAAADETTRDARDRAEWQQRILEWYSKPSNRPLELVGAGRPNVYGIHDLHGLVWEWVEDFSALMVDSDSRGRGDPDLLKFCGSGSLSMNDPANYAVAMRLAMLSSLQAHATTGNLGFRCAAAAPGAPPVPPEHPAYPPDSLYLVDVPLETSRGDKTTFAAGSGRPRIVTMFYASCPMACPLTIDTLLQVQRALNPAERERLDLLLLTMDPETDTPAALNELAVKRRLQGPRWTLARASPADTRKLAAALNIQYRELDDGNFNHASVLVLLDAQGRMRARSARLGVPDPEFLAAVRRELKE